jgi:hypothetical protein
LAAGFLLGEGKVITKDSADLLVGWETRYATLTMGRSDSARVAGGFL